jgi:hypothetical protein
MVLIADRDKDPLEPIDFRVDIEGVDGHTLMVLDVTPAQWEKVNKKEIQLPNSWSLEGAIPFSRRKHE